jgi:hypothetical protein
MPPSGGGAGLTCVVPAAVGLPPAAPAAATPAAGALGVDPAEPPPPLEPPAEMRRTAGGGRISMWGSGGGCPASIAAGKGGG